MKTALNIIISIIIIIIWSDIESNSVLKSPNYSNSILLFIILSIFVFMRIYASELKNTLINKK